MCNVTDVLAIVVLLGLASYFLIVSIQAVIPSRPHLRRDYFGAIACVFIASLLVAMCAVLALPIIYKIPH